MRISTFSNVRTIIRLGSASHPCFIDKEMFDIAMFHIKLSPAIVTNYRNLMKYEVPASHIAGYPDPRKSHVIESDVQCTKITTETIENLSEPLIIIHKNPLVPLKYDRIAIHRQLVFKDDFLLKEDSEFSRVIFIKERTDSSLEYYSKQWFIRLQVEYICPYYSLGNPDKIVFQCDPRYSVEIVTDGVPDHETILGFIHVALPTAFSIDNTKSK